jgi:hypothetical protein
MLGGEYTAVCPDDRQIRRLKVNNDFKLKQGDQVRHKQLGMTGTVITTGAEKWLTVKSNGMVFNWSGHDLEKLGGEHPEA